MFSKISVATDGSPLADKAVQVASELASKCDADLTVYHVLMHGEAPEALRQMAQVEHLVENRPPQQVAVGDIPSQMMRASAEADLQAIDDQILMVMGEKIVERAKRLAQDMGVKSVKGEVLGGDNADAIVSAVQKDGSDLVVLGTKGHGAIEGALMGSVSQKVTRDADCACMIVK